MRASLFSFVFLFASAFYSTVLAQKKFQPGYILLPRGDTLRGLVESPSRSNVSHGVNFRPDAASKNRQFYAVNQLRGLRLDNGKKYLVRPLLHQSSGNDTLRVLLEVLAEGRANLYRSSYNVAAVNIDATWANQFSLVYYYIERPTDRTRPPYLLQVSTFRSDLRSLFSDNAAAPPIDGKFSEATLLRLVARYNAGATSTSP